MGNVENIKIQPMQVLLGVSRMQVQKIVCRADTAAKPLDGKYFTFQDSAGAKHYAWLDIGVAADPAPAGGWSGHAVACTALDSADTIAGLLATVLGAVSGFDAVADGNNVILTHTAAGFANPARDASGSNATDFDFSVSVAGSTEVDVGCIAGDIGFSGLAPDEVDVNCHGEGTTVIAKLVTGYPPLEVTMAFQETDKESLRRAFIAAGQYPVVPVGAGATEVFGYGSDALFKQIPTTQLRLHPVGKADADRTEDYTFWKVRLAFDELTFSGENVRTVPVTFAVFQDMTKLNNINFFMIGDSTQAGLTK